MTNLDIIKIRSSCRTFEERPIAQDLLDKMTEFMNAPVTAPFGTQGTFQIIHNPELKGGHKIGTYGFIKGAEYFIVGKIKKGHLDLEDYGYLMERIILFAESLGLGTCWLGASFTKDSVIRIINLEDGEICPAISPLGYRTEKRGLLDLTIRRIAGSNNRKLFKELFFEGTLNTPLVDGSNSYTIPLEMVRLAPSASNKQPWRIIKEIDREVFHFYLCRTQGYGKTLSFMNAADLQRIDMGIAMSHFELAAKELGLNGYWEAAPPDNNSKDIAGIEYVVTWHGMD